ncbi:MAG: hypothetical protein MJ164_01255 [Alphaproteobacteria bacterium]|nr:hypothetical protein [Alphaproteobacteria bacterium]
MLKFKLISLGLKVLGIVIALGLGIWYLSSSIGGSALTYTSVDGFIHAIGADNGIENIGTVFLGKYVVELLDMLGVASEMFWSGIVNNLWILMGAGFAIFMFISAIKYVWEKSKKNAEYTTNANNIDFQTWFEPVWKLGLRIMIAGVAIGVLSLDSTASLKVISEILISPILYIGSTLSMVATGVNSATDCNVILGATQLSGAMAAVSGSFMCVIGNLYSVMLAGAAGGFALMNYAWLGLGGGMLTWIAGLLLVLAFLVIGFDLFFQIFSILFKVVFVIIFLPILIAALAYEKVWKAASGLFRKSLETVIKAAISVVSISLKIALLFAIIFYAADATFPGPVDGYTSVLPPLFGTQITQNTTPAAESVMNAFSVCEAQSKDADGLVDADLFKPCFEQQKQIIEAEHPGAFDFLADGWSFLILMAGLFLLYYYVLSPKVDALLPAGKVKLPIPGEESDVGTGEQFDIGKWAHDLGQKAWHAPRKWFDGAVKRLHDNGFIS